MTIDPLQLNPFESSIVRSIEFFLEKKANCVIGQNSNPNRNRESNCLEFRLPRGSGATTLCHYLVGKYKCPIGLRNIDNRAVFSNAHLSMFGWSPIAFSPLDLKSYCSFINSKSVNRDQLVSAISSVKIVVFDVFRAYCDNSMISQLIRESNGVQFIMFQ